ncbi:MAG: SAM-dependent chlorinase/fluorinase [Leptolyngbya sp. SIO3F4]|nr:SAM-dependent chlorinase/fluorinase [Leptolyngbya sp. SIO3F4]
MGLITLLTDFGHKDNYVGVMKGVIASISPSSQVVDVTHGIQPQDILAARFNLLTSYDYFPVDTIHIVVVDPGVGTQRAAIAAQVKTSVGLQTIITPDNGVLTGFPLTKVVTLTNSEYWRTSHPSQTFHGRDIFASSAAHLARGIPMNALGESLPVASLRNLNISNPTTTTQGYCSSIQYIDHFGNAVTTVHSQLLTSQSWYVQVGDHTIPSHTTYGNAKLGKALALIGSHGYVEIAVNGGSAAETLNVDIGDSVELTQKH